MLFRGDSHEVSRGGRHFLASDNLGDLSSLAVDKPWELDGNNSWRLVGRTSEDHVSEQDPRFQPILLRRGLLERMGATPQSPHPGIFSPRMRQLVDGFTRDLKLPPVSGIAVGWPYDPARLNSRASLLMAVHLGHPAFPNSESVLYFSSGMVPPFSDLSRLSPGQLDRIVYREENLGRHADPGVASYFLTPPGPTPQ